MLIHSADHQRVLLVRPRTRPELWCPPGGRLEVGEDLEQATAREAEEETGYQVEVAGACYAYLTMHKGERTLAVSMACRVPPDVGDPHLEPEEAVDWRWCTPADWLDLARESLSVWEAEDVARVTALARRLLDIAYPTPDETPAESEQPS